MFQFVRRCVGDKRGFTLIELLIVVAIIAILAAILIPNFLRARAQSQFAASKGNLKNLATALESYYVDQGIYPDNLSDLTVNNAYLRTVPFDPCTNEAYTYTTMAAGRDYRLRIIYPGTNPCHTLGSPGGGLSYTPGGGLQESPGG